MLFNRKEPPVDPNSTRWQKPFIFPTSKSLDRCKQELQTLANKSSNNIKITIIPTEDETVQFYATKGGWVGGEAYLWGTVAQGTEKVMVYGTTAVKIWQDFYIGILVFLILSNFLRLPVHERTVSAFLISALLLLGIILGLSFVSSFFAQRSLLANVKELFRSMSF